MQEVTKYPAGCFSWVDLSSTDAAGAKQFYTELMGWTAHDIPIGDDMFYTMLQIEGRDVAALSQQSEGMPSMWNSYVTVDNVDESAKKAADLGGTVMGEPFDVFDSGRMAIVQDPTGAMIMLWQAKSHIGAKLVNMPGTFAWNELATKDVAQAKAFYGGLFGWETETAVMGNGMEYTMLMNKGRSNGGMMQMTEEWGDTPPHWGVYFSVADCDATVEKAKSLGANIMMPPQDLPDVGRISMIQDPQGATLTVAQLLRYDGPPEG